jgi:hypothetical protein
MKSSSASTSAPLLDKGALELSHTDASSSSESSAGAGGPAKQTQAQRDRILLIAFLSMLVFGCANRVFSVLAYQPMNNYPLFVNLLVTFAYIPTSLIYVMPRVYGVRGFVEGKGWSCMEQRPVPFWHWCVLGFLDSVAGVMQSIAISKIPDGSLVVLLLQFAIPSSMVITRIFLKTKYTRAQIVGALIVCGGIAIVLGPSIGGGGVESGVGPWAAMLLGSTVPMCLSSVAKEKLLGDNDVDPIHANMMIAIAQFIFSFPLLPPGALAVGLDVSQIGENLKGGLRCYVGINTLSSDDCALGPSFTNLYIAANLVYNVLILLIIKVGSSNVLWLSLTATVPVSDLIFAIPGVPAGAPVGPGVGGGLPVIMLGLVVYRFYAQLSAWVRKKMGYTVVADDEKKAGDDAGEDGGEEEPSV